MQTKSIYLTNTTSLAYEEQAVPTAEHTIITVSSGRKAYEREKQKHTERIINSLAAAAVLTSASVIFAFIIKVSLLIKAQTGSITSAGCYFVMMLAFTLILLEGIAWGKRSCFAESLSRVWAALSLLSAVTLVVYSALFSPDSGGSIIVAAVIGAAVRGHLKHS